MPTTDRNISDLTFESGLIRETVDPTNLDRLLGQLPEWQVVGVATAMLSREYECTDFVTAMSLAQRIADLAESFDHHPELTVTYGRLRVCWWTHTAGGIAANDLYMAAQCDQLADGN